MATGPPGPLPAEPLDVEMPTVPEPAQPAHPSPSSIPETIPDPTQAPAPAPTPAPAPGPAATPAPTQSSPPSAEAQASDATPPQEPPEPSPADPMDADPTADPPARPGPRAARMQQLYAQSLRRALARLGWDNFAACFPTIAARAEPVLRQVQAQMVDKLGDKCEREFEHIMAARHVVPKLNELEALVADASRRRASSDVSSSPPVPPHALPPQTILAAHLLPSLASHQSLLNARLQTSQSRNALLHEHILRQRAEADALLAELELAVDDVRAANAVLGAVVDDVAREAREGEGDARGGGVDVEA